VLYAVNDAKSFNELSTFLGKIQRRIDKQKRLQASEFFLMLRKRACVRARTPFGSVSASETGEV